MIPPDEAATEAQWREYSETDFTYWSFADWPNRCEPDDHGTNRYPQDCIALYTSRDYNMSDWECAAADQTPPWVVNNVMCRNIEYQPYMACNCDCDVCQIIGDPHVTTYFHPMVYANI